VAHRLVAHRPVAHHNPDILASSAVAKTPATAHADLGLGSSEDTYSQPAEWSTGPCREFL
jgi:hypothetical protein